MLAVGSLLLFAVDHCWADGLLEVFTKAQKNDPTLQAAYARHQGTREQRTQAIAQMLPNLSGAAQTGQIFQDIRSSDNTVYGVGTTDYSSTTFNLTLTQPLFHWEQIVGLQRANAEILRSEAEYQLAVQDLIIRVADLYLKVLAAEDRLTFVRAEQSAVHKHFELASNQFKKGLIPITDLHDAKARKAAVDAQTIEAENLLDDTLQGLREITGDDIAAINALQANIPLKGPEPANMQSWIEAALRQNPAIQLRKYAVEVADKEVSRQNAGHFPTVDLVGSYEDEDTEGSLYGGGSDLSTSQIMVKVNVPIFQGGLVNSRAREAEFQKSVARQELIKQNRQVERQTRSAFLGVQTALSKVEALRQSVESNRLALEAKQQGFLSGLYDSLSVLDAERDLSLTRQEYAKARYDYLLNSLKLKQSTDNLSEKDLQQLAQLFQ
jgi:outer membrane protein